MESDQKDTPKTTSPSPLSGLTKIIAATGVVGGVILHFLGHVSHNRYLTLWGIDPGQFPKSIDWIGINGYYTLFDRITSIFSALAETWKTLALLWLGISGFVLYLYILQRLSKKEPPEQIKAWFLRYCPTWLHPPLLSVVIGGVFTFFIPSVLLVTAMFLAVPDLLGESRGEAAYKADFSKFQKGCENPKPGNICFDLRKDGQAIARGFLIDSSETHIALFDVNQQRARVIERNGTELIADLPKIPDESQKNGQ
jgi:hypothetical protein